MTNIELPELPRMPDQGFMSSYELGQLQEFARAYGLSCYEAGVEKAAKICEELCGFEEDDPGKSAAAAIRAHIGGYEAGAQSERERVELDAKRYRWLREHGACPFAETDDAWDSPEALDSAIDADIRTSEAG